MQLPTTSMSAYHTTLDYWITKNKSKEFTQYRLILRRSDKS